MNHPILVTSVLTLTLACNNDPGADDEVETTTSASTDTDESTGDESTGDESGSSTSSSTTSDTDDNTMQDTAEDGPWNGDPCDSFAQDCPEGEKCVPYSSNGGGAWDALKCVPILGDQAAGEPCVYTNVEDSTDDCDAASWCFNVDDEGNGVCHPFCTGTVEMPECPPMSECTISGAGVITICIPTCDPVVQDCPDATACYWYSDNFNCIPTTEDHPIGEPCLFTNDCVEGTMCMAAAMLPICDGESCCTNFCDIGLGDSQCAALPGTSCVSFFEQGMAPPEYQDVGVCILPP